ncbi:MAG: hypothetical protein E7206_26470 [Clostridium beijerinckii]|nr:hypothetical protein [Clostridium beijerinckii]
MKKRDKHYKDFSNRRPYNDVPCKPGDVLIPFVVDWEMVKHFNMNKDNLETWKFYGKKVLVAFTPVAEARKDDAMKIFNRQIHEFLNQYTEQSDDISLDKMLDDITDEDGKGKAPIGIASLEDTAFLGMVIKDLIAEVGQKNSNYVQLIAQDYDKGEILSITKIKTVNQETKKNCKTSPQKHINYCYCPSIGKSVTIIHYNSSYEKLSHSIKNKFPNEPLPKDGVIIDYTIKAGNIKDISGLRRMDFVIDKNGKLIIGKKHQALGNAEDVLAAGQLKLDGYGMIRRIDNNSGHYRPTVEEASKYPELFEKAGFNLDKAWLYINKYTINYSGIIIKSENVVNKKIK